MTRRFLGLSLAGVIALGISAGCATTSGRLYVHAGPPPAVIEQRLNSPGRDYVWLPGFHRWTGRDYVWMPGRYERAPRAGALWVPGRWVHGDRGWYLVEGHWG